MDRLILVLETLGAWLLFGGGFYRLSKSCLKNVA